MRSRRSLRFRQAVAALPPGVQTQARAAYRRFRTEPFHPSLHFKEVHAAANIWSVRVSRRYRALGTRDGDLIVWFWIGPHAEYDRLIP